MIFRVQPLKGIFRPVNYRYQLSEAEAFKGYKRYIAFFFLLSICVYGISAAFGIGTESLSKEMTSLSSEEFETRKQLFFLGRLLLGMIIPAIFLFLSSLYYWSFVIISFQQLVIVQMSVFCVFLLEKIIQIPLFLLLHIDEASNPFSLGVIVQYITNKELIVDFFSQITIFQMLMITIVVHYLNHLTEKSKKVILSIVLGFFIFCWLIASLLSYIKIGVFF